VQLSANFKIRQSIFRVKVFASLLYLTMYRRCITA